jgi:hypothetical protein
LLEYRIFWSIKLFWIQAMSEPHIINPISFPAVQRLAAVVIAAMLLVPAGLTHARESLHSPAVLQQDTDRLSARTCSSELPATGCRQERFAAMSKRKGQQNAAPDAGVVNWDPPPKRDVVERALSDGMTDPAKIVEWAKGYNLTMTIEEVRQLIAELKSGRH